MTGPRGEVQLLSGEPMAWVDWQAAVAALDAGRLARGDSDAQVLRIAASIAEGIPVDLRGALSGLDERNVALVASAVLHANGRRDAAALMGVHRGLGHGQPKTEPELPAAGLPGAGTRC